MVIASRQFWPSTRGGAERFAWRIARELAGLGLRVAAVTGDEAPGLEGVKAIRVKPGGLPAFLPRSVRLDYAIAETVRKLRPRSVIVNAYWSSLTPYFLRQRGYRLRIATVIHDLGFLGRRGPPVWARKTMLRKSVEASDVLIVPTRPVAVGLEEVLGAPEEKILILGFEGVDAPMKRIHVENNVFDVVQVARFVPSKGHLVVIDAVRSLYRRIPRLRVYMAGSVTDPGYYERVRAEAEKVNREAGQRVVEVLGEVEDVSRLYTMADACVAASLSDEGYGLVVEECMGYGKPVVASDLFMELGVVDENVGYIFPRGNAEALAQRLLEVYHSPEAALERALRGLERVRGHTWRAVAERILSRLST